MTPNLTSKSTVIVPRHVGIVLDGNRRWAKAEGLPLLEGHNKGAHAIEPVVRAAFDSGVEFVSLFVFSTENWERTEEEVGHLMKLFIHFFKKEGKRLVREGIRIKFAGSRDRTNIRSDILAAMDELEDSSKDNVDGTVVFCFNYGGKAEIVDAVKSIVETGIPATDITEDVLASNLYLPEVPDCDLIVRTSGEQRISGFQLWRSAYAEFIWVDKNWPDFTPADIQLCLSEYASRQRRIGK